MAANCKELGQTFSLQQSKTTYANTHRYDSEDRELTYAVVSQRTGSQKAAAGEKLHDFEHVTTPDLGPLALLVFKR